MIVTDQPSKPDIKRGLCSVLRRSDLKLHGIRLSDYEEACEALADELMEVFDEEGVLE